MNNFGYNVPFYDLKPLWFGLFGTALMGIAFSMRLLDFLHWSAALILVLAPLVAAHIYIKMFVENALPDTQRDFFARVLALAPDFDRPPVRWLPFVPSLRPRLTLAADPEPYAGSIHPMLRLQERLEALAGTSGTKRKNNQTDNHATP
ncbi:hypothetical protein OPIT5_00310 (plasmid) [Opitutaceae bacterium TAV5]|nr:hypothetical protein OPIT5_00310 [Opitutaceae bacterium TAV5]